MQVSCENPNGSAASSQGWAGFGTGAGYGSTANAACQPGAPMIASLSDDVPEAVFSSVALVYTPPPGSTLVGGRLGVVLSGDGSGTDADGDAVIYEPAETAGTDARIQCGTGLPACSKSGADYSGEYTIPADLGGDLYLVASCNGTGGFSCETGGRDAAFALAEVSSADLLLQNDSVPSARRVPASALRSTIHGTTHLALSASDPDGPGVFRVTATIDGRTVYRAIPDTNGGTCEPIGTDTTSGALEFDYQQPCPQQVATKISIPTAKIADGTHTLHLSVTDAAGNEAQVLSRTITTDNARETPTPAHGLKARFLISWRWQHATTRLLTASAQGVPADATVTVSCTGAHCPAFHRPTTHAGDLRAWLRGLAGLSFSAGDRVRLVVAAPHRRAERIRLTIENGRRPVVRLLVG